MNLIQKIMTNPIQSVKDWVHNTPLDPWVKKWYYQHADISHLKGNDLYTFEIMKRVLKKKSNCIDIGCHVGEILKLMLRVAPSGTHYAFEPIPYLYQGLQHTFGKLGNVHVHESALGDEEGTVSFSHVVNLPGWSGFNRREYPSKDVRIEEITVKEERLDDVIPDNTQIDFIKIDVEGGEYKVLLGAEKLIRRCRPVIVFEFDRKAAPYYGVTAQMMYDLLVCHLGLSIAALEGYLDHAPSLNEKEFARMFESREVYYFVGY
ncbi:MAG: FkbM family methyltransferase, partial [Bacteroidetes bacterium]